MCTHCPAQERADLEAAWQQKIQAHEQQRADLEAAWRQKVKAVEEKAQKSRLATEARVAGIISRLQHLAEKEAKREKQRGFIFQPLLIYMCACAIRPTSQMSHKPIKKVSLLCQIKNSCSLS